MWFLVQVTNLKKVNILDHYCILHIMLLASFCNIATY